MTGSEALDCYQVAERLTRTLGRTITYRNPSLLRFVRRQRSNGTAWSFVLVMAAIYTTAHPGLAGSVTGDTQRLLGRPPISMCQYVEDYQACWQPG